jgi:type I restriction enzyme S subunit
MAAVSEREATIKAPLIKPFRDVRKGYTYFGEGDVLFAKITPCMQNGKHAIARGLTDGIGFASTEFHVIRPGPRVLAEWIHAFIRQPEVLEAATRTFTGTVGQQRVPDEFLTALEIPLPPLPEQRRIAAILTEQMNAVERARRAVEEELETIEKLPAALLREAFTGRL